MTKRSVFLYALFTVSAVLLLACQDNRKSGAPQQYAGIVTARNDTQPAVKRVLNETNESVDGIDCETFTNQRGSRTEFYRLCTGPLKVVFSRR